MFAPDRWALAVPPLSLSLHRRQILAEDKTRGRWDATPAEGGPRPLKLTVRREALLEDTFAALAGRGEALKGRLYVSAAPFVGETKVRPGLYHNPNS